MRNRKENIGKKKWYRVWWKSLLGITGVITASLGILKGVYFFTEQWHDYKLLKEQVLGNTNHITINDSTLILVNLYIANKTKSYAVGFRVFRETDQETGIVTKKKMYRDWNGVWNEVYIDYEYSDLYGVDYYYYIDKNSGEKIYCW